MTLTRRQALVLAALDERGPQPASGIAHATGISAGIVRVNLKPLAAWGDIEEHPAAAGTRWGITTNGRYALRHHHAEGARP